MDLTDASRIKQIQEFTGEGPPSYFDDSDSHEGGTQTGGSFSACLDYFAVSHIAEDFNDKIGSLEGGPLLKPEALKMGLLAARELLVTRQELALPTSQDRDQTVHPLDCCK